MPLPKGIESLQVFCSKSIVKNLGKGSSLENEIDSKCWVNPFEFLSPLVLIVSIIDAFRTVKGATKRKDHLGLLITRNLDKLDLSSFPKLSEETAVHLLCSAARQQSPLRILKFHLNNTPFQKLQDILPAFTKLQALNVSCSSSVDDQFLTLLGTHCPNLESLVLQHCHSVTDVGIQHLCLPAKCSGGEVDVGEGILKSLVNLDIQCTSVSIIGARLALEHFTQLRAFSWDSSIQLVAEMYLTGERRPLGLKNLQCTSRTGKDTVWNWKKNSLAAAIQLCPSVVDVDILSSYKATDDDLKALLQLSGLRRLRLYDASQISFNESLLPILKKFGHKTLDGLFLCCIKEMNLGAIVEHCSELRCLVIRGVERYIQSGRRPLQPNPQSLRNLELLSIWFKPDFPDLAQSLTFSEPSSADLSTLFASAPELLGLRLRGMASLNDRILEQAILQHGFPYLKELDIEACRNVTKEAVGLFLALDGPLLSIQIERHNLTDDCDNDEGSDPDPAWGEIIRRKNLHVYVSYCECPP